MRRSMGIRVLFLSFLLSAFYGYTANAGGFKEQKAKVDSLNIVGWDLLYQSPELVVQLTDNQLKLAKEMDYTEGLYYAYYQRGMAFNELQIFDESVKSSFAALEVIEKNESNNFNKRKIKIYKNIGLAYFKTYGYETSQDYYLKALDISYQLNDSSEISSLNYNLGVIREKSENYPEAIEYYLTAKQYLSSTNKSQLSKIYNSLGNAYSYLRDFMNSNEYYSLAIESNQSGDNLAYYISNIGDNFFDQGALDSAIYYYQSALDISEKKSDQEKINWIQNNLGDAYLKLGNYSKAIDYYASTFNSITDTNLDEEYQRACKNLASAYQNIGDYQNALKFNELYLSHAELLEKTRSKLLEQNSIYRMKEMEWQMEKRAQERQIALSKNIILFLKLSSILLLALISVASYQAVKYYKGIRQVKNWLATE